MPEAIDSPLAATLRSKGLSASAKVLLVASAMLADGGGVCHASSQELADATGSTPEAVRQDMRGLVAAGLVSKEPGITTRWRVSTYHGGVLLRGGGLNFLRGEGNKSAERRGGETKSDTPRKPTGVFMPELPGGKRRRRPPSPDTTIDTLVRAWNTIAAVAHLSAWHSTTRKRRAKFAVRLAELPDPQWWETVFHGIAQTPALHGKNWLTLDWLLKNDTNVCTIQEQVVNRPAKPAQHAANFRHVGPTVQATRKDRS